MQTNTLRARLSLLGLAVGLSLAALLLAGYSLASANGTAGVALQPVAAAQAGLRSQTITYTLRVTNTGSLADVFTVTTSGNSWPTSIFIVSGTVIVPNTSVAVGLNSGEGRTVLVQVQIPADAVGHDVALITARTTENPAVFASAILTTSVYFKLYLPLVKK